MFQCCAGIDCDALVCVAKGADPQEQLVQGVRTTDFGAGDPGKLAECRRRRGHAVQFALPETLPRATWTLYARIRSNRTVALWGFS
jgi:hypothetical protein